MKADIVLTNVEAVLPNQTSGLGPSEINQGKALVRKIIHLGLTKGLITSIQDATESPMDGNTMVSAKGLLVLPGIIDSQVHFREPGLTHKEDIASGSRAAALGGVTSFFEMPNTNPPTTTVERLNSKFQIAQLNSWVNYAFFAGGADDNLDQVEALEQTPGCPGIKVFMGSSTGNLLIESESVLENLLALTKRRLVVHSEDEERLRERKEIAIQGKDPKFHDQWRDAKSALLSTTKLLRLARKLNKRVHVLHVSTADEMALLESNKDLASVEILPQHLFFYAPDCYSQLGTRIQQNPPIRDRTHFEGLWKAVSSGVVDVMASDHAPHTLEEKIKPYPSSPSGVPGVQTLLLMALHFAEIGKMPLTQSIQLLCEGPRRIFGCSSKGRIAIGLDADLTVVDLNSPQTIEGTQMASRAQWTPYEGLKVQSRVLHTIVNGRFVMRDTELVEKAGQKVLFSV